MLDVVSMLFAVMLSLLTVCLLTRSASAWDAAVAACGGASASACGGG